MLPQFPQFKKLELSDKNDVEKITHQYPPYSDFNFVSMWAWDIKEEMRISVLNENLVVRFTDYLTGESFYSFLGNNKVNDTAEKLLELSKKEGLEIKLKLVPEESIKELDLNKFKIKEDRDNFDYILETKQIEELKGDKHRNKRAVINNLLKNHKIETKQLEDFTSIVPFLESLKDQDGEFKIKREIQAVMRLLKLEIKSDLVLLTVTSENKMVSFIINEIPPNSRHSMGHFLKVNSKFHSGLSTFLLKTMCGVLKKKGFDLLNMEQDLGISGLKFWKENHCPAYFLKKYIIFYK
jgi:hypothetical protein